MKGTVFVSIANRDKRAAIFPVKRLHDLGFRVLATVGTAQVLRRNGVDAEDVGKFSDGPGNIVEKILAGEVDLVLNTPWGSGGPRIDGYEIRTAAVAAGIPCLTTVQAAAAAVQGIEEMSRGEIRVRSLQHLHAELAAWRAGESQ
jgi:carbamoyl-phosphate synthase large subunit